MKKQKIKNLFLLLLCGFMFLTFAVGSGEDVSTTSSTTTTSQTSEVTKYKLNEDIYIKTNTGEYRVKFTNVTETADRNQFWEEQADRVIVIEYEYENISQPSDLLVSSLNFKLYDKDNNILETYPADTKYGGSVGTGRKAVASEGYALNNENNYVELDFYGNMFNSKADCRVILEW